MPITGPDAAENPAPFIDHTLLKATTTAADITLLCEEAVEYGFAAVCIPPTFVRQAADTLYGSQVAVATVVGFPLGYETRAAKTFQAQLAVDAGAGEVDMVIDLGAATAGDFGRVEAEIAAVVGAVPEAKVKVIIECCLFDDAVKVRLARAVMTAGAAMVKTSTGFSTGGATRHDVRLLAETVAGHAGVKAAGGIRDLESCRRMIEAGATRVGTSAGIDIARQWLAGRST